MENNESIITKLHLTSISILLALNIVCHNAFGDSVVAIILIFLINAGVYTVIYFLCSSIYKLFWKIKYKECNISGTWYHYHIIDGDSDYLRFGTVEIRQDFYDISMTGENYSLQDETTETKTFPLEDRTKMTYWYTISGSISTDGQIITAYRSERTCGDSDIREGIHHFVVLSNSIENNVPKLIIGKFKDCAPCSKFGCINMFRSKAERDSAMALTLAAQKKQEKKG